MNDESEKKKRKMTTTLTLAYFFLIALFLDHLPSRNHPSKRERRIVRGTVPRLRADGHGLGEIDLEQHSLSAEPHQTVYVFCSTRTEVYSFGQRNSSRFEAK